MSKVKEVFGVALVLKNITKNKIVDGYDIGDIYSKENVKSVFTEVINTIDKKWTKVLKKKK